MPPAKVMPQHKTYGDYVADLAVISTVVGVAVMAVYMLAFFATTASTCLLQADMGKPSEGPIEEIEANLRVGEASYTAPD